MRKLQWVILIAGLAFIAFIFQLLRPSPRIAISKQTTYITAPLTPDGLPDYEQYMRQKLSEGVTPENNAAVLLIQALWPSELQPEQYEAVIAELGLDEIPSAKSAMQPVYGDVTRKAVADWMPKSGDGDSEPNPDAVIGAALDHAWTSQQIPPLAKWVDANQKPLDLIIKASRRPRYYSPSPTLLDAQHDMLISMLLPGVQAVREAARGLSLRAMQRIGENQLDEAWQDIVAIFRLSSLVAQGPTLVEQLVAMALRGMAFQATAALLSSDRLTKEQAQQIQKDLASVPPMANVANCVDQTERIAALDSVVYSSIYGFEALSGNGIPSESRGLVDHASIDWNIILRTLNNDYDELAAAMRLPPGAERRKALNEFDANIEQEVGWNQQIGTYIKSIISRDTRSDLIGSIFAGLMLPAVGAACSAEDRTNSVLAMTQLSAALAVYRTSHHAYPEKIEELAPAVIEKVPVDSFEGKPFVYKRLANGYLLYTVGQNGKDDGGSNDTSIFEGRSLDDLESAEADVLRDKIPSGADDFSIRIPQPAFKLPAAAVPK